jgi:hypothetical protein
VATGRGSAVRRIEFGEISSSQIAAPLVAE